MRFLKNFLKKSKYIRRSVRFFYRLKKKFKFILLDLNTIESVYSRECPTNQSMVDIFKGSWTTAFPDEYNIKGGEKRHYDPSIDWRVTWVNSILPGGIKGLSVLELGPFEAYNTRQLIQSGAKSVVAIEGNNLNFLKCLIVKEIMGMGSNARFLYGDIIAYLESNPGSFDIVWASGVLYHSVEPLKLLALISKVTDKVFIYSHYYDKDAIWANPFLADHYCPEKDITMEYDGYKAPLHYRFYNESKDNFYCGGVEDFSFWMEKKDILGFLDHLGFSEIKFRLDQLDNPHGPVICFLAEKTAYE